MEFLEDLTDVVCGHNVRYNIAIIVAELRRCGMPTEKLQKCRIVDTMQLAYQALRGENHDGSQEC